MAEARAKAQWAHTSAILALIANVHRDPKKHGPFKPEDFNPLTEKQRPLELDDNKEVFAILKQVFVTNKEQR